MDDVQLATLERFATLLGEAPLNLVASGDRTDVWSRHIVEAIAVVRAIPAAEGAAWLDLGTGGGLPGIVLATLRPDLRVTMLDARGKKARAVVGFVAELGLENASVLTGRAEHVAREAGCRERYDGVVTRAVGRLDVSLELARGFVRPGGHIAVVRGEDAEEEVGRVSPHFDDLAVADVERAGVTDNPRVTNLVTMRAAGGAPAWVPRADGTPHASPLAGAPSAR